MLRWSIRSLLAARGRLLLTAVAIVLGVGVVAATFVLTDTAKAAADAAFAEPPRRVDVVVRAAPRGEGEIFSDITGELFAEPMRASARDEVARVDGVAAVTEVFSGDAQLLGRDGRVVGGGRAPLGRSVDASFAGQLRAGRVPHGPGEVVIDRRTANDQRFDVWGPGAGDGIRQRAARGHRRRRPGFARGPGGGRAGRVRPRHRPPAARPGPGPDQLPGGPRRLRRRCRTAPRPRGRRPRPRLPGVHRRRPGGRARPQRHPDRGWGHPVLPGRRRGRVAGRDVPDPQHLQRHPGLPDPGAGPAPVYRGEPGPAPPLGPAPVLGRRAFASLAGLLVGIGLAWGFGALLRSTDEAIADVTGTTRVLPRTIAVALAVGIGTTVVSAWGPARRATRVPPVPALRGEGLAPSRPGRARTMVGVVLALGGAGLVLASALADPVRSTDLLAGSVAVVLGVLALGPALAWSLSLLLGSLVRRVEGVVGALARGNAARNPGRTAATVLPLAIGLALVSLLATLAASTKASAAGGLDRTLRADFRLSAVGAGMHQPRLSPRVAERLAGLPELAAVAAFQDTGATVAGQEAGLTATDPAQLGQVLSLHLTDGALPDLTTGAIAVSRAAAETHDLTVGAPVTVRTARGERILTVRAVFDTSGLDAFARQQLPLTDYLVTPADYRSLAGGGGLRMILAKRRGDVTRAAALAAITRAVRDHPTVEIASSTELRRQATAAIDPTLRLFYSLLGLAVVVGLFGVVNTLVLSILERARELGLLRAIGMDRRQVRSMIAWEAVIVAAIGTGIGVSLGAFLGWAVSRDLDLPATVPVGQLVLAATAATVIALLAATLPARRAARVDPFRAVAAA